MEPLKLGITGPNGAQPLWIRNIRVAPYLLKPPPDTDDVSFHVQPLVGLILISDALAPNEQDTTGLKGVSLRLTFAMMEWTRLALEAELTGAQAGTAHFDNVSLDGQMGDLERSTTFLRALGGLRLRFGRGWMPTVHLGIGGQLTSRSSRLRRADGSLVEGPGAIGLQVPISIGAGVERQLGKHWAFGAKLTGVFFTETGKGLTDGSLEAGLHLGYYWEIVK